MNSIPPRVDRIRFSELNKRPRCCLQKFSDLVIICIRCLQTHKSPIHFYMFGHVARNDVAIK